MFLNSTSLRITWEPPLLQDQNGVIRGYNISYNVSNSEEETDFFVSSIDNRSNVFIDCSSAQALQESFYQYQTPISSPK